MSRRCDEEIVFPNVGITLKILQMSGNRTRIGIQAPDGVDILRKEVLDRYDAKAKGGKASHAFRNLLNTIKLSLELYERQVDRGLIDAAHQTYLSLLTHLREIESGAEANEASPPAAAPPPADPEDPLSVLIVEDQPNERELLAGLLRMDGCQVDTAADGVEAVDRLHTGERPHVVLLDMHMPRIAGPEVLNLIRQSPALDGLLVFAVSGSNPQDLGVTIGTPTGVDEWLSKPLNPSGLVLRMRRLLHLA
ncbi:MAG: response regulator [Planctomycetaceae bacterium]